MISKSDREEPDIKTSSPTVLLVDDQEPLRSLIRNYLETAGCVVLEAGDSAEAILLASDSARPIDLLLTDIRMPGMNGRELAELLRRSRPEISVLYMTGDPGRVFTPQEVEASNELFLFKPFDRQMFLQKVRNILGIHCDAECLSR
jgi:CheY-like chemotaxis protein